MNINRSRNNEQKTHNTTNDKGVHPSLGLHPSPRLHLPVQLPMDRLYYLIKVIKNVLYNAQNAKYTTPMVSEHPQTPSWAFRAPHLAKI